MTGSGRGRSPIDEPDESLDEIVHDALVELNQLRVSMRMDPVEGLVRPRPDAADEGPTGEDLPRDP